MGYLETAAQFYAEVAQTPEVGLCCVQSTPLQLPGLQIPEIMQEMNYVCGSTVHPTELVNEPTVEEYTRRIVASGFGQIEIRAWRPYRLLDAPNYQLDQHLLLESLDSVAFKVPIADDGACIFTGKTAIYSGNESVFDDRAGHILPRGLPAAVCDKAAAKLLALLPEECVITPSTWHYQGDGCC
jgi:hypothetical protein